ncbi:filamentous hemagglutinin N-terminal domain-containing protein [Methyloversatilis sp. XJ19-13]|uniref:two-partner secretion domain-containing protein n=1 Tax=Methyloversatilis sp. XJ19-13 TaxID=2963430 RepID=UPI00211CF8C6|nr:filamentous hemagglutinin N-terminal domain-containing protein [Methyloversatilis sp. XJ19-13]MCQ9373809.1 filamentous hemagglutinin N-terminal domain-containing protein [Methyloversatilis sp. XJ19-13]
MKFRPKLMMVLFELAFGATLCARPAYANPSGAAVTAGAASFAQPAPNVLQVTNAPGTVINWQHFSIAQGEITRFVQQSAQSAVLNRVVGGNLSEIMGTLQSNGQVFLVNPAGIVIGPNAVIDTNGFVASTLAISDADFINQRLRFSAGLAAGDIRNEGVIRTAAGGRVALIAPHIENTGLIDAPNGDIVLAAGQAVTLSDATLGGISFELQAPNDSVVNLGTLSADGGAVKVFAGTLRQGGQVRADRLALGDDGQIMLVAANKVEVEAGATVSAAGRDGQDGGRIVVDAGAGEARIAGSLSAASDGGEGGAVDVFADRVLLAAGAMVDVSGDTAGGEARIGGDYQGANEAVRNASATTIEEGVRIAADALESGDGGRVIVWADRLTRYAGELSARGGAHGGDGGFAEISGKEVLQFADAAKVDLSAPLGVTGKLLLDPRDILIASNGGQVIEAVDELCDFSAECSEGWRDLGDNAVTIRASTLAALNANVTLQAGSSIFVLEDVALTAPGASLTLMAALDDSIDQDDYDEGMIWQSGRISTNGGDVTLSALRVHSAAAIDTGGGDLRMGYLENGGLGASDAIFTSGAVATSGGAITLNAGHVLVGAALGAGGGDVTLSASALTTSSTLSTGGGDLMVGRLEGDSLGQASTAYFGASVSTAGGDVSVSASSYVSASYGINAGSGRVQLTSSNGTVSATGLRAGSATLDGRYGVSASVVVEQRVDATAPQGYITLSNSSSDALLNVGTLNSGNGVTLYGSAGVRQAEAGSIAAPSVSVTAFNGTIATASAPLVVNASSVSLNLSGAAFVTFTPSSLNSLALQGSAAALAASSFNYGGLALSLVRDDAALNVGLGATTLSSLSLDVSDSDLTVAAIDTPATALAFDASGSIVFAGPVVAASLNADAGNMLTAGAVTVSGAAAFEASDSILLGGSVIAASLRANAGGSLLMTDATVSGVLDLDTGSGLTAGRLAAGSIAINTSGDLLFDHLSSSGDLDVYASGHIDTSADRVGYDIEIGTASSVYLSAGAGLGTLSSLEIDASRATYTNLIGSSGIGTRDEALRVNATSWLYLSSYGDVNVRVGRTDSGDFAASAIWGLDIDAWGFQPSRMVRVDAANVSVDLADAGSGVLSGTVSSFGSLGNLDYFWLESETSLALTTDLDVGGSADFRSWSGSVVLLGQLLSAQGDISVNAAGYADVLTALSSNYGNITVSGSSGVHVGAALSTTHGSVNLSSGGNIAFESGANIGADGVSISGVDIGMSGSAAVISSSGPVSLQGRHILAIVDGTYALSVSSYGEFEVDVDSVLLDSLSLTLLSGAVGRIHDANDFDVVRYFGASGGEMNLRLEAPQPLSFFVTEHGSGALVVNADTQGGSFELGKYWGDVKVDRIATGLDLSHAGSVEIRAESGSIYAYDSFNGGEIDLGFDDGNSGRAYDSSAHVALYAYNGSVGSDSGAYGGDLTVDGAADYLDIAVRDALNLRSTHDGDLKLTLSATGSGGVNFSHQTSGLSIARDSQAATVVLQGVSSGLRDFDLAVVNGSLRVVDDVSAGVLRLSASSDLDIEAKAQALTVAATASMSLSAGGALRISGGSVDAASVNVTSGSAMNVDADGQFIVWGGDAQGATADLVAGGDMNIDAGSLAVLGGSGQGATAKLAAGGNMVVETGSMTVRGGSGTGASADMVATANMTLYTGAMEVSGGSGEGATAFVRADSQHMNAGDVLIQAGSGSGAHAGIASAGCLLSSSSCYNWYGGYYGYNAQYLYASSLRILGSTAANAFVVNGMVLDPGGYFVASGGQRGQELHSFGDIVITGGHGALNWHESGIKNMSSEYQYVSANGALDISSLTDAVHIDGDTAEVGIRNEGGSGQSVDVGSISILNQAQNGYVAVAIDNLSGAFQSVSADTSISVVNASASGLAGITQRASGSFQSIGIGGYGNGGTLTVNASGGGQATVFSQGDQDIDLEPYYYSEYGDGYYWGSDFSNLLNGTSHGTVMVGGVSSLGQSGIVSLGDQQALFAGRISVIGGANESASSVISSAGLQELEAWEFDPETHAIGGSLLIGDAASSGSSSLIAGSQHILAGSVQVSGGASTAALARIEAVSELLLSTIGGGIVVQAGSLGSAKIDPPEVSIVSTGGLESIAGGPGTSASIVGGDSLTVAALGGNTVLTGASGATTGIDSGGVLNVISAGDVVVNANGGDAAFSAVSGGSVRVGAGTCTSCSSAFRGGSFAFGGLRGTGLVPPPIVVELDGEEAANVAVADLLALISDRQDRGLFDDDLAELNTLTTASGEDPGKRKVGACR